MPEPIRDQAERLALRNKCIELKRTVEIFKQKRDITDAEFMKSKRSLVMTLDEKIAARTAAEEACREYNEIWKRYNDLKVRLATPVLR